MNKLRSMGRNAQDADNIQLEPRRGLYSSWASGRSSHQGEPAKATGNRLAAFSSAEPSHVAYEGRVARNTPGKVDCFIIGRYRFMTDL